MLPRDEKLTHCGLAAQYDVIGLDQHLLSLVTWRRQATASNNVDVL